MLKEKNSPAGIATEVAVTIGDPAHPVAPLIFLLHETNAPKAYDGFGTLTLYEGGKGPFYNRYVLIDQRHMQWQVDRYLSGLHRIEGSTIYTSADLAHRLWARMTSGLTEE